MRNQGMETIFYNHFSREIVFKQLNLLELRSMNLRNKTGSKKPLTKSFEIFGL